jgi:hypothetical protein
MPCRASGTFTGPPPTFFSILLAVLKFCFPPVLWLLCLLLSFVAAASTLLRSSSYCGFEKAVSRLMEKRYCKGGAQTVKCKLREPADIEERPQSDDRITNFPIFHSLKISAGSLPGILEDP